MSHLLTYMRLLGAAHLGLPLLRAKVLLRLFKSLGQIENLTTRSFR